MNVDEAYRRLSEAEELPVEVLNWSLEHWDEAAPRYMAKLRAFAAGSAGPEPDFDALFYVIHLAAEKKDERAYTSLCQLIATDEEMADWFGDATFETLPGVLINLCDGDPEPLQRAIESDQGDEFTRGAALSALAYLVRSRKVMTDSEMNAYLSKLARNMKPREESYIWTSWAFAVAQLGFEPLRAEVARVFSKGWIDREEAELEDFYALLALSKRDADGLAAFHESGVKPFGAVVETFSEWENGAVDGDGEFGDETAAAPIVNEMRDVGRNDPCPCGSGKKYKKCCLPA